MSSWPLVKYVDGPSPSATVRYDFNDQAATPAKKVTEFDPGVPTLEGDPDAVGQQWGFRSPQIVYTIKGSKAQALAALSAVSREQLRRTNWVMYQLSAATSPRWLKTYRTGYQPITLDQVYVKVENGGTAALPDTWKITVPLVADAFAYGERVTIAQTTLGNALAATNPLRIALPAIKGDAPTGLRVKVTPLGASGLGGSWIVAVVGTTAGTITDPTYDVGTADIWTAGAITAAPTADAAYLGGSYRTATYPPGTFGTVRTLSATLPAAPPVGRYKVLVRCELDAASGSVGKRFAFQFGQMLNGTLATGYPANGDIIPVDTPVLSGTAFTFQGWVDLGEFTFPFGSPTPDGVGGVPTAPLVYLNMFRATDTGVNDVARLDAIKLIPVAGPTIKSCTFVRTTTEINLGKIATQFDSTMALTWDTDSELLYKTSVATGALIPYPGMNAGGLPIADPAAAQNVLFCFPETRGCTSAATAATAATGTWLVDVSYHPRYLHVGDGT